MMKPNILSTYRGVEKNCGDRLKVLNLQVYDMSDRHNLQIYEILSVIKTLVTRLDENLKTTPRQQPKAAPREESSCGDDYKTKTKYKGPEKTLGSALLVAETQIKDMFLIDGLDAQTIFNVIKDLVEAHIVEIDELDPKET
jgi:hypothetical protein